MAEIPKVTHIVSLGDKGYVVFGEEIDAVAAQLTGVKEVPGKFYARVPVSDTVQRIREIPSEYAEAQKNMAKAVVLHEALESIPEPPPTEPVEAAVGSSGGKTLFELKKKE